MTGDTLCVACQQNEFIEDDECVSCGADCLICSQTFPGDCEVCIAHTELEDGECYCTDGYYYDWDVDKCT